MSEESPLTGSELFPKRVQSSGGQTFEKIIAGATVLLSVATAIICIVFGIKYHPEHVIMGAVVLLATVQFLLIARLYKKDLMQDRTVMYISVVIPVAICICGLIYSTSFTAEADPFKGCSQFKNASDGACLTFSQPPTNQLKCFSIVANGQKGDIKQWNGNVLPKADKSGDISCEDAQTWIQTCMGKKPSWNCSK